MTTAAERAGELAVRAREGAGPLRERMHDGALELADRTGPLLDRVQVGLSTREDGMTQVLDKHQTRFTALMAVASANRNAWCNCRRYVAAGSVCRAASSSAAASAS